MARQAVVVGPGQVQSLNEQVARLGPDEPYMAVIADGKVFVRGTRGLPRTLIELWRGNPAMMIPDSAGYRPESREVNVCDL